MRKAMASLAAAAAISTVAGPASANHSWGNYHWARTANPVSLQVIDAVDSRWDKAFTDAVADWDKSTVLTLAAASGAGIDAKRCNPIAGKILTCNAAYGKRGWLGIASIWATGDHITKATTKLNDSYHDSAPYNSTAWRALVTCQEIGHDFGLAHQDENFNNANLNTCMDYTNDPSTNQHPNAHDYAQLETIYRHTDSTTTAGATVAAGSGALAFREVGKAAPSDAAAAASGDWGQAVHHDGQGRPDMFELDTGDGHRRITHVFWVPGFRPLPEHMHD